MPPAWFLDLGDITLDLQVLGYALDGMELEDDAKTIPQVLIPLAIIQFPLLLSSALIVRLKVLTSWKKRRNLRLLGRSLRP